MKNKSLKEEITGVLISLKIQPTMSGFDYLREAIKLCLKNKEYFSSMTKDLYPILASHFHVKTAIVERCIRFSIDKAFQEGGLLSLNQFYNVVVFKNDLCYSNSEMIAILTEKVRIDLEIKGIDII